MDLLTELAQSAESRQVVLLPKNRETDGTRQDFVLRFFAYLENYQDFDHSVRDFLLSFCKASAADPKVERRSQIYKATFTYLAQLFPDGIRRRAQRITPVNLYEAVAVGAALALEQKPDLKPPSNVDWVRSDELRELTTGATNDRRRVSGRIEYVRDRLLDMQ